MYFLSRYYILHTCFGQECLYMDVHLMSLSLHIYIYIYIYIYLYIYIYSIYIYIIYINNAKVKR